MTSREKPVLCKGPFGEGCGKKAVYWCRLMTRSIARCEAHKDAFISRVFAYDLIDPVIPSEVLR